MNLVQKMLSVLKCDLRTIRWASSCDSLEKAWAELPNGPEAAYLLVKAGYQFDEVVKQLLEVASDVYWLKVEIDKELCWKDVCPEAAAYNVCSTVIRSTDVPEEAIADALRSQFPAEEVVSKIADVVLREMER